MSFDFQKNHFQLFGLAQTFALDAGQLDRQFRTLQTQVHPDKSAHLSDAEQRMAMQQSTRVNESYQTLRNPLKRARYLLALQGVDTQEETNTAMPIDFLMAQMERREAVSEAQQAQDADKLDTLQAEMRRETRALEHALADKIDGEKNYVAAAELVRKLRFMEKLAEEIYSAYDAIDS